MKKNCGINNRLLNSSLSSSIQKKSHYISFRGHINKSFIGWINNYMLFLEEDIDKRSIKGKVYVEDWNKFLWTLPTVFIFLHIDTFKVKYIQNYKLNYRNERKKMRERKRIIWGIMRDEKWMNDFFIANYIFHFLIKI